MRAIKYLLWITSILWVLSWALLLYTYYTADRDPTDTNVEFYYVPPDTDPSEWHNEDTHPICCANETDECRRCVTNW
jgi:hypothetical protein